MLREETAKRSGGARGGVKQGNRKSCDERAREVLIKKKRWHSRLLSKGPIASSPMSTKTPLLQVNEWFSTAAQDDLLQALLSC